jgi:hypothetical protein
MKYNKPFEEDMSDWEPEPRIAKVNFEDLCQKLQGSLSRSYVENQSQEKEIEYLNCLLSIKKKRIEHLEGCLAIAITHGEFDLTNDEEDEESLSEYLKARQ